MGFDVVLQARTKDLLTTASSFGEEKIQALLLESEETHPCELVIYAIGITPRTEVATVLGAEINSRGGIVVQDDLQTSISNVYAIGECASWKGETYGLIAPGVEMAEILAFNLTVGRVHKKRGMVAPDLSTRLKVFGLNVACFGDYFADLKPPSKVKLPGHRKKGEAKEVSLTC